LGNHVKIMNCCATVISQTISQNADFINFDNAFA
jgi:hypothetical protein